jgi:hypothetical protein
MLFCDRLSEQEMLEAKAANRESVLEMPFNDFRKAFPRFDFRAPATFDNSQCPSHEASR